MSAKEEDVAVGDGSLGGFESVEKILEAYIPPDKLAHVQRILYGWNCGKPVAPLPLARELAAAAAAANFDLQAYRFGAAPEQLRPLRIMRVGLVQHGIQLPTSAPFAEQRQAIHTRVRQLMDAAGAAGVQVLCLQEFWPCPFFFCTRERQWLELAESAEEGPSTRLCQELARKHGMVVISPILERDEAHGGTIWNTAVVVGSNGGVIGKHRKNHITRVGDFNESTYYMEGNTGHPVFETAFGRIAVNICYGRHIPLNCQAFGLNGAEVVFNPCATVEGFTEPMWGLLHVCHQPVGTEVYPAPFTSGDGKPAHRVGGGGGGGGGVDLGPFYGSSYVTAPDASRTPSLARNRDGLLVADLDLNLCQQVKDRWGFQMTSRYEMYAEQLARYVRPDFTPQVIRDPAL
ncbi:hypothetical protein CHLNCDRAFT_135828 [Chlorella variabilis]|uniref:Beta-ureidopropionase n=1 Tax=Chlorella variabilis TaxID=554065 RepID=E1ZJ33_CHLVA|nr:hypothetical protein CHLNCDRAFT_135828 [Chlorella variabilis]EFN54435.1 hypothetical protein CHLNCDRAFT_135828 [Chlorella variabilis]|eukprot:XP_005846537.1 hypothetical protein CHLNCDRAFT_135828 [Chlorella variabilis]